ncbi:MAG: glucose-1-phosphate cytidylyltransferase [Nanoarchaeota archaeon]
MKVVILCGGRGTRMNELTDDLPKPLASIGGKPILWHIMKIYAHYGFKEFVLCLGYKGEKIKEYFMDYHSWKNTDFTVKLGKEHDIKHHKEDTEDWTITFANTGVSTNTGGRIKKVEKYVTEDQFFCTYGDGVSNINIQELLKFHNKIGKIATLTCVKPLSQFGILKLKNNLVTEFKEKPLLNDYINGGFFVFKKEMFDYLKENDILEKTPLETLARKNQLAAFKYDGFWQCMDTFKDYQALNDVWHANQAKWKVW